MRKGEMGGRLALCLVSRLGEIQQFFKCKNSAILCNVNAKVCQKSARKVTFGVI